MPALRGIGLFGGAQVVALIAGLLLQITVARALSPIDYGRFVISQSILQAALILLMSGVPGALRQFVSAMPGALRLAWRRLWLVQVPVAAASALGLAVAAPVLCRFLNDPQLSPVLSVTALELALKAGVLEPCWYLLNALSRHRLQAVLIAGHSVLRFLCVAWVLWLSPGLVEGVGGLLLSAVVSLLLVVPILTHIISRSRTRSDRSVGRDLSRHLRRWMGLAPIGDALNYLLIPANIWLLKAMSEDQSLVGVYGGCYMLAQAIFPFGLVLSRACFAQVAQATAAGHPHEAGTLVWQVFRVSFVATALGTAIALLIGDKIVACLYGSSFRGSGSLLGLLCLGMAAMAVQCFLCDMLSAARRLRIRLALLLLITAASIPTTTYLARAHGAIGAAWALAFTGVFAVTAASVAFHCAIGSAIPRPFFPQSGPCGAPFVNPARAGLSS